MTFSVLRLKDRLKWFLAVVFLVEKKNCRFTPSWHVGWYKYGIIAIYNKIHKGIKSDESFLVFKKKQTTLENFFSEAEWLLLWLYSIASEFNVWFLLLWWSPRGLGYLMGWEATGKPLGSFNFKQFQQWDKRLGQSFSWWQSTQCVRISFPLL